MVPEEKEREEELTAGQRVADTIASFSGSLSFLSINAFVFLAWIILNTLGTSFHFDPFPFQFLTMAVSLEAIFLSIFVLVSQNRQAAKDRETFERDLESDLRSEQLLRAMGNELHQRLDALEAMLKENTELTKIRRRGRLSTIPSSSSSEEEEEQEPEKDTEEEPYRGPTYTA